MNNEKMLIALLKEMADEKGNIFLWKLDLTELNNITIQEVKTKGNLTLNFSKIGGNLSTSYNYVEGNLYQDHQTVEGNVFQEEHQVKGSLRQHGHYVGGDLDQYFQEVMGDLDQNNTTKVRGIVNNDMTEQSWEYVDKVISERELIESEEEEWTLKLI